MSDTVAEITISNRQKVSTHLHCFDLWRDNRDLFDPFSCGLWVGSKAENILSMYIYVADDAIQDY